jgi:hypothetical protein
MRELMTSNRAESAVGDVSWDFDIEDGELHYSSGELW